MWKTKQEQRIYQNSWYQKNKERRKSQIRINVLKRRAVIQQKIFDYLKGHPCVDCGDKRVQVLEFDHLRDKKRGISLLIRDIAAWPIIEEEIAKCEVVCANCHRIRTYSRSGSYRNAFLV